jgi:hypothetical protein
MHTKVLITKLLQDFIIQEWEIKFIIFGMELFKKFKL